MSNEDASKEFWSDSYKGEKFKYSENRVEFKKLFERFLPKGEPASKSAAIPGSSWSISADDSITL